jgi:hypothetical protein
MKWKTHNKPMTTKKVKRLSTLYRRRTQLNTVSHSALTYLESNGTQYIDTDVKGQSGLKVELSWRLLIRESTGGGVFGSKVTDYSKNFSIIRVGPNICSGYNAGQSHMFWNNGPCDIIMTKDNNVTSAGGTVLKTDTVGVFNSNLNMTVFALNVNGVISLHETMRLYYCKIWDCTTGVLIRDFIPVLKDSIYCVFDKVSQTYFYNKGTGVFTGS